MKTHDVTQGTAEWLAVRAGIPTASELDQLISPTGKLRTGDMPNTYLCRKLAERWTGYPLQSYSGGAMEQGSILEDEAIPWYEATHRVDLQRPGFLTTDDGSFGCSPDAMDREWGMEIKCPQPGNHVKWLLGGKCPDDHLLQCHGGMYVTHSDVWTFVSYCRGFPSLVVDVKRDEQMIDIIADAVSSFKIRMKNAWDTLEIRNGGEPPKRKAPRVVVRDEDPFGTMEYKGNMTYEQQ